MYNTKDTIAAIATPPGEGGVAIIRISGESAIDQAAKIFSGPVNSYKTHTVHYGQVHDQGLPVDDVLLIVMRAPRSYTGEDTVEIHCHGGSLITRRVLDTVLSTGVRQALPGEFTFRAYMNGKLDLSQAEAVQELIAAKNELAVDAAGKQLQGRLSEKIRSFQKELIDIAAILEAWVDFPDEGLEFASFEEVINTLNDVNNDMKELEATYHDGKIMHDGISLCLVGSPNAGKSSLMNALLDKERAIVTPIAGTTRDLIEDHLRVNGLNFRLIDTAGIRETAEIIEEEGIRRSKQAMQEADLVLLVLDIHKGVASEEQALIATVPEDKTIAVWNKIDLIHNGIPQLAFPAVTVSAKEKKGLKELHAAIDSVVWKKGPPSKEEIVIINVRHKEALSNAIESCQMVINGLGEGTSPEFVALDMRHCLGELGKVIGSDITEDVLTAIFSKFCIGK